MIHQNANHCGLVRRKGHANSGMLLYEFLQSFASQCFQLSKAIEFAFPIANRSITLGQILTLIISGTKHLELNQIFAISFSFSTGNESWKFQKLNFTKKSRFIDREVIVKHCWFWVISDMFFWFPSSKLHFEASYEVFLAQNSKM